MADLFRKTSLEKLSSPEQLDKMIVITPPSFWFALVGAGVIIATALVWAVLGRLPINVETQGIYVNNGGTYSVYSEVTGIVEQVSVEEGDVVKKGDILAYLNPDDIQKKIQEYEVRIQNVEVITMESQTDVVTADNKNLIDIKSQILTVNQTLLQNEALLELQISSIAEQRQKTSSAEQKMRDAEIDYYNSLNENGSTDEQLAYSEAQSNLANAESYLAAANSNLDQANISYNKAYGQYQNTLNNYNKLIAQEDALKKVVEEKQKVLNHTYSSLGGEGTVNVNNLENYYAMEGMSESLIEYVEAVENYNNCIARNQTAKEELQLYLEQYKLELDAAETVKKNYQKDVNYYTSQKNTASKIYESAKIDYVNRITEIEQGQNSQTQLSNAYNLALNQYNSEQSKLDSLLDARGQLEVQVNSERELTEKQIKTIYEQFEATKSSITDQLRMECEQYKQQLETCTIISTVNGTISDIAIVSGSAVNQGSELVKVQQEDKDGNVIVCYVALSSGKKITEGMNVLIYPTTVNKQEYGHMEAVVEKVDSFVASAESLRTQLGNDNLVEAFLKDGPVVAVVCRLREDASTSSGYYWSSTKGKDLILTEGTLVEASVVIEEKAPITMLIPYIKEKLMVQPKSTVQ